ncbi:MAG: TonB-dependent receptor [Opitutales bacterium]|nr:TonB-dependent receptor [Opitutales bacterium]
MEAGLVETVRLRLGFADYEHVELEGDEVGTRYDLSGWEGRLEVVHAWDNVSGVWGAQASFEDSTADGEEAFTPPSETTEWAAFFLEEFDMDSWQWSLGGRIDYREVETNAGDSDEAWAPSVSVAALVPLSDMLRASVSLTRSSRAPNATELYADGPHAATAQYEIGDPTLDLEVGYGIDASLRYDSGDIEAVLTLFGHQFDNYVYSQQTGEEIDELDVYEFTEAEALVYGVEAEITWHALHEVDQSFHITGLLDITHAENRDADTYLPRTPPVRLGGRLDYTLGNLSLSSLLRYAFEQDRTAPFELPTEDYVEWDAQMTWYWEMDQASGSFYVKATNLLDEEIRHHTSFIKDQAPEPGRGVSVGVTWEF